jgi:hypothetical protein
MGATVSILREKLHQYIDHVEDKKIKAFIPLFKQILKKKNWFTPMN